MRDPIFLQRFTTAYTGSRAPMDALWWLEHPDRATPEGLSAPAITLQNSRANLYQRDASSGSADAFQAELAALQEADERAQRAFLDATADDHVSARHRQRWFAVCVVATAAVITAIALTLASGRSTPPLVNSTSQIPPTVEITGEAPVPRSASFSIPNVYSHYGIRPPGQLLVVSTATAHKSAIDVPLRVPAGVGYFTIVWRCDPNTKITWRLSRGSQVVQTAKGSACTPDLQQVIKARFGRPDPTLLQLKLNANVRYSFAVYTD